MTEPSLDFNHRQKPPTAGEVINGLIDAALAAANGERPRRAYLGGSRLGDPCARRLQYEFLDIPRDPETGFSGQTLRIFAVGHVYAAQIALYQAYMGLTDAPALFTAVNKDTAELHHELVPFDGALAQATSDKGVRVLQACDAGEWLPRVATEPEHIECSRCPWRTRCWS